MNSNRKNYDEAIQNYKDAVEYFQHSKDPETINEGQYSSWLTPATLLGSVYHTQNKDTAAANYYTKYLTNTFRKKIPLKSGLPLIYYFTLILEGQEIKKRRWYMHLIS